MEVGLADHVWSLEELVGLLETKMNGVTATQDDKDKITGQTRREYREAKQELAEAQNLLPLSPIKSVRRFSA